MGYNKALEDQIDHFYIRDTELIKKKQMDGVGWLINGNMCTGIYEDLLVVRVDPEFVESLVQKPGIHLFGKQQEQQTFISVAPKIYGHHKALRKFLAHALKFTSVLEPRNAS